MGLLQLPDWIERQSIGYIAYLDIDNYIPVVEIAIYWLTIGFIAHSVLRGIWVGMVGLSFVFPEGIRCHRVPYVPKFKRNIERIISI